MFFEQQQVATDSLGFSVLIGSMCHTVGPAGGSTGQGQSGRAAEAFYRRSRTGYWHDPKGWVVVDRSLLGEPWVPELCLFYDRDPVRFFTSIDSTRNHSSQFFFGRPRALTLYSYHSRDHPVFFGEAQVPKAPRLSV
jgi:hypothetical protein